MSYSLSLHLVDLAAVRGAVGSGDQKLRRMIGGRFKRSLAAADEYHSDEIRRGAPTRYEALRAVIEGGPFDPEHGWQYSYAYQMICEFHGRPLFNNCFSPFRGAWLADVDAGLRELGVKSVTVSEFSHGSAPDPIPAPGDFPGYGEWSADRCRQALAEWEATDAEQRQALAPEVREAVECCAGWLRDARAKDGGGVVGFFH